MSRIFAILGIFGLFAAFSLPLIFVGDPESPAYGQLRTLGAAPDIAIIGDSRAHVGISPARIREKLTKAGLARATAHNFAVDGTDAAHHFSFAVNGLLRGNTAPRIILWAVNPLQFDETRSNNRLEQLKTTDIPALWRAGAPRETILDVITMAFFPPWKHRPLTALVISDYTERAGKRTIPLQTRLLGLRYIPEVVPRRYVTFDDGHVPFEILEWEDRFNRGAQTYVAEYARLKISGWHLNLARALARGAREAGVQLIFVETPTSPWFRSNLANGPKHLGWRQRIQDIAREEQAVFWNHSGLYDEERAFGDPGHMALEKASEYSSKLGDLLVETTKVRITGL